MLDLGRTFLQSVDRSANTTALVDGSVRLTWGEWARAIGGVQRGLAALGLRHGDHVLSVLQNRYEAATLHWACQFSGLVMTPLNWRAKPEEIDYVLRDSEARLLVFEAASEESLESSVLGKTVTRWPWARCVVRRPALMTCSKNAETPHLWPAPKTCP